MILLPLRAELLFTLQYEIPCNIFANLAQCNPVKISLGYLSQIFPVCLGLVLLRKSRLEKKKRKTNFLWSFLSKPKKILSVNHWRYFHVYLREYLFVYDWGSPSRSVALPGIYTPIYSRSLERKKSSSILAFAKIFSGIRTTWIQNFKKFFRGLFEKTRF